MSEKFMLIFQVSIILLCPFLWIHLTRKWSVEKYLSPVVMSYLTGILLANFDIVPLNAEVSKGFGDYSVVLAIPLLLYSTDLLAWVRYAKSTVLSFLLCVLSGILCSGLIALLFKNNLENSWQISGMLVGVYTGGTPNMNAIGIALEVQSELLVLLNAADIFCGGIYLIFLTSIAYPIFSKILPAFEGEKSLIEKIEEGNQKFSMKGILILIFTTLVILGMAIGLCFLIFGNLNELAFILLILTTLSIWASFFSTIRNLKGAFEIGEYLLLMFCVAIGMQADFSVLIAEGGTVILYTGCVLVLTIILHLILSKIFKIDADTFMITSTAALYGPVFIGQIASTIKNRTLIVSGMATGLVGYAIGNYLGISVAYILKNILN
jgi:uncharacterized membrane protein